MEQHAEHFIADVWGKLGTVYQLESQRLNDVKDWSRLQAGVFNYLRVSWKKGKSRHRALYIDIYEPFSWSDDSYEAEAGPYIEEITEAAQVEQLFSALCIRMDQLFQSEQYGPRFFDYHFQVILEFEIDGGLINYQEELLNERKLEQSKQELSAFIEKKVMADMPVRPSEKDEFFFAQRLIDPHFFNQSEEEIDPLISHLLDKHRANKKRYDQWIYDYTRALKNWAEELFLTQHFEKTGEYSREWALKEGSAHRPPAREQLDFFVYAALQVGQKEPNTRRQYLELAKLLGSQKAADYLLQGSGLYESKRTTEAFQGTANDVLQTIEIRIVKESESAYRHALRYLIDLLTKGFPKGYHLTLKSKAKNLLPVKNLAKSKLHQFFANGFEYPALFSLIADYAQAAMEEYAWYGDVEPSEKSAMPGTYAVFGLGLYSTDYFPLVESYMALVDAEHQSVQDHYAEALIEAHGLSPELMPALVAVLLASNESAKPLKELALYEPDLLSALIRELENIEDYQREVVLYRIFGGAKKLKQRIKKEPAPIKEALEHLLLWMNE